MNLFSSPRFIRLLRGAASLVLCLGIGWLVWPANLGGEVSYLMVSGTSMEPGMHTGDLAMVRERGEYRVGEIVAYRVPEGEVGEGSIVIHRIIGGDAESGYATQGDNRDRPDTWHPTSQDIVGERIVLLPAAGNLVARVRNPLPLAFLAGILTLVAMLLPAKGDRKRRREVDAAVDPALALPKDDDLATRRTKLRLVTSNG